MKVMPGIASQFSDVKSSSLPGEKQLPSVPPSVYLSRWLQPQQRGKRRPSSVLMPLHLDRGRYMVSKGREVWVVKFQGVDTPEAAQALGGQVLLAMPEEHGDLEEDEFYVQDLIGLDVYLEQTQEHLGQVVDHYSGTGDHDVLRIELDERHGQSRNGQLCSMLLPFTKEFAPDVDMEERKLSVCPPEALAHCLLLHLDVTKAELGRDRRRLGSALSCGGTAALSPTTPCWRLQIEWLSVTDTGCQEWEAYHRCWGLQPHGSLQAARAAEASCCWMSRREVFTKVPEFSEAAAQRNSWAG
eukprot:jgi/Astpho2/4655/Aster-x1228